MEYDATTGTNVFTRQLNEQDARQFSSGVSKYLYGVLKQKVYNRDTNAYQQDPDYERRLAAAAAGEQEKAIMDASLRESAINYATAQWSGYTPNFQGGKLVPSLEVEANKTGAMSFYGTSRNVGGEYGAKLVVTDKSTKKAQEAQNFINSMRKKFKLGANLSDEQVWNTYAKSQSLGAASKDLGFNPDRAKVVVRDLASAQGLKVQMEGDPKVYNLGDPEGQAEFESKYNLTREQLLKADKPAFVAGAVRPLAQQTGDNNTRRGGVVIGQVYKPNGEAISATITNDRIFTQAQYQPYNQSFEAARTLKPQRVQLGGQLGDYLAVPYMNGRGELSVINVPISQRNGKAKVIMQNAQGVRMQYGLNSDELSQELTTLASQFKGDEVAFSNALMDRGTHNVTLETLLMKGHFNMSTTNKADNPITKGASLSNSELIQQIPSNYRPATEDTEDTTDN